ncbi:MAG: hypothetical protein CMJ81_19845 [Planctomycetaceae bacterium]|nr:hypothetical protein [Planctomycetaceae bacterium]
MLLFGHDDGLDPLKRIGFVELVARILSPVFFAQTRRLRNTRCPNPQPRVVDFTRLQTIASLKSTKSSSLVTGNE